MMDNLLYQPVMKLAKAIREKQLSSYELVTACIDRIEKINPKLNAVVQTDFDQAINQARRADDALQRGELSGVLHGIPMTIKDSLDTADVITTAGTKGRTTYVPKQDATVVARLRSAGAILLGKTNTPELTASGITDNFVYGRTNNPYDLNRTSGGSSGGAAAIVAVGGAPFDIGSDSAGSIRMPSHYCGVTGIKPTAGRVPRTGHILSFDIGMLDMITHIGPLARYIDDLGVLLPVISGVDKYDPSVVPVPWRDPSETVLSDIRIAYYKDNGIKTPTPETQYILTQAVDLLSDSGLTLVEDRPPGIERSSMLLSSLLSADGGYAFRKILQASGTDLAEIHPTIRWTQTDQPISTLALTDLIAQWNVYRSQMLTFIDDYDAIVCPTSSTPATEHGSSEGRDFSYTNIYNLTGWPAVVVRGGTSNEGLPIGVQIIARPWREDIALALAKQIELGLGGWQPPEI